MTSPGGRCHGDRLRSHPPRGSPLPDTLTALRSALVGRYTLERELGRGGMSAVYLARDLKHDRPVAFKVLLPELAVTLGGNRFQREIRLAARLQHPHILPVHDSGETAGRLWFTMPFVDGESVRERLRREKRLPVEAALRITHDAAQALQYAHDQGVVHRDIKPENLLLTRDGNTLVADFGIARAMHGGENLTGTGASIGTPAYMSPEQANGEPTDARTDVYSLGVVLFEMLTGKPPYTGATPMAIVAKWLTEPVPTVRAVRPEVPETVDEALRRALTQNPTERFATTADFVRALERGPPGAGSTSGGAPAATPLEQSEAMPQRWLPAALLLAVLLLGVVGFFAWRGAAAPASAAPKVLAVLPFDNLGDSADAYFADGIADELRAKLSRLDGVQVIARGSSNQYRRTAKAPEEIARELGAGYLLTATVQWDKASGGPSRVRVSPELVEARTGVTRWARPFDAAFTDVFSVQADIAGQVAGALHLALSDSSRARLAEVPTRNLEAYAHYLRSRELRSGEISPEALRGAIASGALVVLRYWLELPRAMTATPSSCESLARSSLAMPSAK